MAGRYNNHSRDSLHLPAAEELLSAFKISGSFDSLRQSCMEFIQNNDMHAEHIKRLQQLCEECIATSSPLKPITSKNDLRNQLRESITKELSKSDFQRNLESMVYSAVRQKEEQINTIITESLKSLSQMDDYVPQAPPVSTSSVSESTPRVSSVEATPSAPNETALDLLDSFGLSSTAGSDPRKKGKVSKLPSSSKHASVVSSTVQQPASATSEFVTLEQSKTPPSKAVITESMLSILPTKQDLPRSVNKDVPSFKKRRHQISTDEEEVDDSKPQNKKTDECLAPVNSYDQTAEDRLNSDVENVYSPVENSSGDDFESLQTDVGRKSKSHSSRLKGSGARSSRGQDKEFSIHYSPHLLRKRRTSSSGPEQPVDQLQPQGKRKRKPAAGTH